MTRARDSYDVAVIGAGPVGCAAALACARRGQRVLLLEQDPGGAIERVVGEWLHPPAMDVLDELGVDLVPPISYPTGKGFVLFSDDGEEPVVLPYRTGRFGFSVEHGLLVETLRAHCERHEGVEYLPFARAVRVERGALTFERRAPGSTGSARTIRAERIVGASGTGLRTIAYGDVVTLAQAEMRASHRIAALTLHDASLPFEGYLHLHVGGAGPTLAYRIAPSRVRVLCDVPLSWRVPRDGGVELFEAFAPALPEGLVEPFREAVRNQSPVWSHGELRPRTSPIKEGIVWIGDAARSYHPMAAIDLTLGLGDARAVATAKTPADYVRARKKKTRIAETIAVGMHELLADGSPETIALRRATYRMWRTDSRERLRTMGFVAGDGDSALRFGSACLGVMARAAGRVWIDGAKTGEVRHAKEVSADLLWRIGWMVGGALGWTEALPRNWEERLGLRGVGRYGAAIHAAEAVGEVVGLPSSVRSQGPIGAAIARAHAALIAEQAEDGSFEGEVSGSALLAAEYVLACHVMERPIAKGRARRLLQHFAQQRLPNGTWAPQANGEPDLAVTALVYASARLLGLAKDDTLLAAANAFIRAAGGVLRLPARPRLWLALVGLYAWEGVSPLAPEVSASRGDSHARLAHLGLATLHAERYQRTPTPTIRALRDELFVAPYEEIDFAAQRDEGGSLLDRGRALLSRLNGGREGTLAQLHERIRYELRASAHAGLSPVSGLLDVVALWTADAGDPDVVKALERFEGWIWEDEADGARVCPVRSTTWDTALAVQALSLTNIDAGEALAKADAFLRGQQIRVATGREHENDRVDPTGGYAIAGAWHGWAASHATGEAMLARLRSPLGRPSARELEEAARFLVRTQSDDGAFGYHEPRRTDAIARLSGPESSLVEPTAASTAALAAFRERCPDRRHDEIDASIERAVSYLRRAQRPDGSWPASSGVYFIHGTMHGVRGLLAGGVPSVDPQVRRACGWLKERQRGDGGWGEHFVPRTELGFANVLDSTFAPLRSALNSSAAEHRYVEHEEAQIVQSAWALSTLLEARDPDFVVLERAARFLAGALREDGTWPRQDPSEIFAGALVDYRLHRACYPLLALATYQERARTRALTHGADRSSKKDRRRDDELRH